MPKCAKSEFNAICRCGNKLPWNVGICFFSALSCSGSVYREAV